MISADDLLILMQRRRSFKLAALKPDPLPREQIEKILQAAMWAPNHGQTEPWRYRVFTGESRRALGDAFGEAYRIESQRMGNYDASVEQTQRQKVWSAPVWISIGMQPALRPDGAPRMPEEEELAAVACSVQNLHLMATALGLGGQWTSNFTARHAHTAGFVGIEPPGKLLGFFFLGWPAIEWPRGSRLPMEDRVSWAK